MRNSPNACHPTGSAKNYFHSVKKIKRTPSSAQVFYAALSPWGDHITAVSPSGSVIVLPQIKIKPAFPLSPCLLEGLRVARY
jgi:hypothetical protein